MENIIIVESPSKSKTIGSYVGNGYTVLSSKGHIRDLATTGKDGLGIDIDHGFLPNYQILKEKEALVQSLKHSCKGKRVFLATDPDREGEAIAYHLAQVLDLDLTENNRIEFHEITKSAVCKALEEPHPIDLKMVDSQECRRMIDRILGFKLSKLLQKKIGSKSAGRVQSVALKMIVDLEKEIQSFVATPYYEIQANFNTFQLKLFELNGKKIDEKNRITDRIVLENLKPTLLTFSVEDIATKLTKKASAAAFTTSTLQQEASLKLGMSPSQTMRVAQSLYEGKNIGTETVGLITYMRTDSTRLAESFVKEANQYIVHHYGEKYLGNVKIQTSKNMQDAHEAIRPTSLGRTPEQLEKYLTKDEYRLYQLIYQRALASLMAPSSYHTTRVTFQNTNSKWYVSGQELLFDGYLKIYKKEKTEAQQFLQTFHLGESFHTNDIEILDKETQPKSRYSEASLIKDLEDKGIGRPSTYAQIIQTLKERKYVTLEKRLLIPTNQGILTTEQLENHFSSLINISYTAQMEKSLDEIASGSKDKIEELTDFYDTFQPLFQQASEQMESIYPIVTKEICPQCGNPLVIRKGKYGEFVACSNYPQCKYIKKETIEEEEESADTHILCPVCQKNTLVRRVAKKGKNKGQIFYACKNFPACKTVFNDRPTEHLCPNCHSMMLEKEDGTLYCSNFCQKEPDLKILCPECQKGYLVKRTATRGKNKGHLFYGCSNYPKCKKILTAEEYEQLCRQK